MRKMLTAQELNRISVVRSATEPAALAVNRIYNAFIGAFTAISVYCIVMISLMMSGSMYGYGAYTKVVNSHIGKQIDAIVENNGFADESDELSRIHNIFTWVTQTIAYPEDAASHNTAREALETHEGNCMGQAQLFYLLLQASGINDCEIVRFTYDGLTPTHVAVAVNINGQYYIADTTNKMFMSPQRYITVVKTYGYGVSMSEYWNNELGLD